jgi:hypothetical protein
MPRIRGRSSEPARLDEPEGPKEPAGLHGHQFVLYGDCCSGRPNEPNERTFAAINSAIERFSPAPEFVVFAGDAIWGAPNEPDELRRQWRHFTERETAWATKAGMPVYHCTSNHDTYDRLHEEVWREVFRSVPDNGPPDQLGLSYWIRRGDLLLVFVNTSFSGLGGYGHVEHTWLESVLRENADAAHKLVVGHHPVHPVNGYDEHPLWCIVPEEGRAFWKVLVRHGVAAYLCSHIIAFDVQVHDGVPQVLTGGAGTEYGPGGFMGGDTSYHHFVEIAIDDSGVRYQVIDTAGRTRLAAEIGVIAA